MSRVHCKYLAVSHRSKDQTVCELPWKPWNHHHVSWSHGDKADNSKHWWFVKGMYPFLEPVKWSLMFLMITSVSANVSIGSSLCSATTTRPWIWSGHIQCCMNGQWWINKCIPFARSVKNWYFEIDYFTSTYCDGCIWCIHSTISSIDEWVSGFYS